MTMELTWDELARFWSNVDVGAVDDCWPWRAKRSKGYGIVKLRGQNLRAHRVAFLLSGGTVTDQRPLVLHRCDNPPCCNPFHHRAGTHADNGADKAARGRVPNLAGELNQQAKLTAEDVAEIRSRYSGRRGEKAALAREYGVTPSNVHCIIAGKSWRIDPTGETP